MEFGPQLPKIKARSSSFGKEKLIIILIPIFSLALSRVECSKELQD